MCGLVGVISSNMLGKHKDAFKFMLYVDTVRGFDSTGVAAIRANYDTDVLKSAEPGHDFVEHERFTKHLRFNDWCWIGHNRWATVGKKTKANAHPFLVLNEKDQALLVGAHNGTLEARHELPDHDKFGTDSEALYHWLAHGITKEVIGSIRGAWALTWVDATTGVLHFLRNDKRPLFYAVEEDEKTIMWASEPWMLRAAFWRENLKMKDAVHEVAVDALYSIELPDKMNEKLTIKQEEGYAGKALGFFQGGTRERWTTGPNGQPTLAQGSQEARKATTTTPPANRVNPTETTKSQSGTTSGEAGEKQTPKKEPSSKGPSSTLQAKNNVVSIGGSSKTYKGFNGVILTKSELDDQLSDGCSWCELEQIKPTERFAWIAPARPICFKCITGEMEHDNDLIMSLVDE